MKSLFFIITLLLFMSGCSLKNFQNEKAKIIIIKTPQLKFSDLGYVRNSGSDVEVELFMLGKSIKKIEINHLICVDEGCMFKSTFNEEYLNPHYPDDLLQNIFLGKVIYDGEGLSRVDGGFEQTIEDEDVYIHYRVNPHTIYFKDKRSKILFKIKDTK